MFALERQWNVQFKGDKVGIHDNFWHKEHYFQIILF